HDSPFLCGRRVRRSRYGDLASVLRVDEHVLDLCERLKGVRTELATQPGALEPAERRPVPHGGVRVHRQVPGRDAPADARDPPDAAGPDPSEQAVLGVVAQRDRVRLLIEGEPRDHRTEDLLPPDPVITRAGQYHGGRVPEPGAV